MYASNKIEVKVDSLVETMQKQLLETVQDILNKFSAEEDRYD